jgi:hypothetical protein
VFLMGVDAWRKMSSAREFPWRGRSGRGRFRTPVRQRGTEAKL